MSAGSYINRPNRVLRLYAAVFLIVLYAPVLFLPAFSVNDSLYAKFPFQGFTWKWYAQLWERDGLWNALMNSVRVGIIVSILSTTIGIFAAKAITRYRIPGRGAIVGFIMLPLVVPLIIFAVALLVLINWLGLGLSLYTVGLGHLVVCIPFAIATLIPRFEGFDRSVEEASGDLGENAWWTFWRITLPMVAPGVVASLLLCFTVSFDEFIMAFMLSGTEATLPIFIWGQLRFPREFPTVLAMASLIILASFLIVFLGQWINRDANFKALEGENQP